MIKSKVSIFILFFFITNIVINSQTKLSLSALGGINYTPMKEYSHYINPFSKHKTEKITFSGNVKLQYSLSKESCLNLSIDYITANASFDGGYTFIIWNFEAIPLTLGYEYNFYGEEKCWNPYLGAGLSYVFQNAETKNSSDTEDKISNNSISSFGLETHLGIAFNIYKNLKIISEIKYRYFSDIPVHETNHFQEANLSGLALLLGVKLGII